MSTAIIYGCQRSRIKARKSGDAAVAYSVRRDATSGETHLQEPRRVAIRINSRAGEPPSGASPYARRERSQVNPPAQGTRGSGHSMCHKQWRRKGSGEKAGWGVFAETNFSRGRGSEDVYTPFDTRGAIS
ncbi:unnamed protein product, partial [Laminaria digitata]